MTTERLVAYRDREGTIRVVEDRKGPARYYEISDDHAIELAEALRDLAEGSDDVPDQMLVIEDDSTETLEDFYERLQSDDRDPPDIGDVITDHDPLAW